VREREKEREGSLCSICTYGSAEGVLPARRRQSTHISEGPTVTNEKEEEEEYEEDDEEDDDDDEPRSVLIAVRI
jgi:hypothetical protein